MVKVQETEGGIITDIAVDEARADALLLVPAVEHHQRLFGRVPGMVAADRGFYSGRGERRLVSMGVKRPVSTQAGSSHPRQDRVRATALVQGRSFVAGRRRSAHLPVKEHLQHETQPLSPPSGGRPLHRMGCGRQQSRRHRQVQRRGPLSLALPPLAWGEGTGIFRSAPHPRRRCPESGLPQPHFCTAM